MLAFNFASRTFAYKRLAQGLSRSVSDFSSFIRKYLDPVVQADQCAQYVDDIGIAANNATDLEDILVDYHNIFARLRMDIGMNTDFKVKLTPKDDEAVYSQNLPTPIHLKEDLIVELALMHKYEIITVLRFSKYCMTEKLNPFYKLWKAEVPINITSEVYETYDSVNNALNDACQLAIKQPSPGKQLVLMTHASFRSAGYALMIENNLDQKISSKRRTFAPVTF